jgi:CubicO group peptidase (beta-lactamase class C family)
MKGFRKFVFVAIALLTAAVDGGRATAVAQSVASTIATPTLAERLDRLATEVERNRIDLHVPGVALAIVRGDEVIFARGFGLADVSKKTPVTPRTSFFIGSLGGGTEAASIVKAVAVGLRVASDRSVDGRWPDRSRGRALRRLRAPAQISSGRA